VRKKILRMARMGQCCGRDWLGDMSFDFAITARHRLQEREPVECLLLARPFSDTPKTRFLQSGCFKRVIQNEPIARIIT
jgi:hypothetical protein